MIKDITQEVFLAIWKNARQFSGHSSVAAWVFSIARNKMMDKLRARYKRQEVLLDENQDDSSIMKRDFTEQIVEDIGIDIALDSLEPIYKELTYLVLIQGLSIKK
ncbi:RNA polymerase sigma factor, sigma-70 family [Thermoflavimicrobium dichotomicum]|uniref:RNA polymerase sigma factor, sigma-70 family n=2 Tax=Thermoflavimicrobium dichotomicum TaxID=46223 RepID=A0A1I3T0M3_9BACL|nr:RNA polymerase sigma factor, sigma-70 family [Thermoflavimicrobium dichotomicum]